MVTPLIATFTNILRHDQDACKLTLDPRFKNCVKLQSQVMTFCLLKFFRNDCLSFGNRTNLTFLFPYTKRCPLLHGRDTGGGGGVKDNNGSEDTTQATLGTASVKPLHKNLLDESYEFYDNFILLHGFLEILFFFNLPVLPVSLVSHWYWFCLVKSVTRRPVTDKLPAWPSLASLWSLKIFLYLVSIYFMN